MRTTVDQDRKFIADVIQSNLLEDAIQHIKDNFTVEEIFGKEPLEEWAEENGYIKEE